MMSRKNRPWRRLAGNIAVLVAAFAATTTVTNTVQEAPALAAPTPGQWYYLKNVTTGLRLEVAFASTQPGAPIIQGGGTSTTLQAHWRFAPVAGSYYQIINRKSTICLNTGSASVRVVIRQSSCAVVTLRTGQLPRLAATTRSPAGPAVRACASSATSTSTLCHWSPTQPPAATTGSRWFRSSRSFLCRAQQCGCLA